MRLRPRRTLESTTLAAYLENEVTASEAAAIEAELAVNPEARRRLEQLRRIRDAMTAPVPELDDVDLVAGIRAKAQLPVPRHSRLGRWFAGAAIAAVFGVAIVVASTKGERVAEFRAKSAGGPHDPARWSGIQVYRIASSGAPELVARQLHRNDGLLFSYSNLGPQPFAHLMIVAVAADGRIFWFHPAYQHAGTNPISIDIAAGEAAALLGEVIHHDFAPGHLGIYGIFTQEPLRVLQVERWLRQAKDGSTLPSPGARVHRIELEVVP